MGGPVHDAGARVEWDERERERERVREKERERGEGGEGEEGVGRRCTPQERADTKRRRKRARVENESSRSQPHDFPLLNLSPLSLLFSSSGGGPPDSGGNSPLPLLIYSFGASAVLLYGVPESKLAQPRNVIGGQVVSAVVGAAVRLALGTKALWVTAAAGMALALTAMEFLSVVHPPGGATALIASSARTPGPWHGFRLTASVAAGSTIMVLIACAVNNLHPRTRYPTYWWGGGWPPGGLVAVKKGVEACAGCRCCPQRRSEAAGGEKGGEVAVAAASAPPV